MVRIDPLFPVSAPARAAGNAVTFEPGARTAWHTHPLGQVLIVTGGCGRAQREGGPIEEIRPGDVVVFAPGEKHWHGAAPTTAMTHIAIQEALDGKAVSGWKRSATNNTGAEIPFRPENARQFHALLSECDLRHTLRRRVMVKYAIEKNRRKGYERRMTWRCDDVAKFSKFRLL